MSRRAILWASAVFLGFMTLSDPPGQAEQASTKTLSPYFFIEDGDPSVDRFPLKSTDVKVNITGVIADVTVLQTYRNEGERPLNARYVFPASTRAAVHGMTMTIGEEIITAKIKARQKAREVFEQAKKNGKSASLLNQQRPNVFSMHVTNIMPGDEIGIALKYSELLVPTDGTYAFVYPTVVGPRYSDIPEAGGRDSDRWLKNPYLKENRASATRFNISLRLSTGIPVQEAACDTHLTDILWEDASRAEINLSDAETSCGDRDFILKYRLSGKEITSGLMLYEGDEENFFLLTVQPPKRVQPAQVPPREYIFVVDVSGSMHGFPLNTAKELLRDLIGNLRPVDTFNLVLFAGGATVMSPESLPASDHHIQTAVHILDRSRGGGGTELKAALRNAMALPKMENASRTMIVVTDGYIAAEKSVFRLIEESLDRMNVFAFGIGGSVNRYLIEGMAKAGQGEPFIVTEPGEAREVAERFRAYIASPVLTGVKVRYDGFEAYDVEPVAIPDLFASRPVMVYGKYRGKAEGVVDLTGMTHSGPFTRTFNVSEVVPGPDHVALPYLWARTRIARLSDFSTRSGDPEDRAEVTSLGLTYNLLTPHTSFVAVHEIARNTEREGEDVDQPLPLPHRVSNLAVGCVNRVPEPEMSTLLLAMGFLSLAMLGYRLRRMLFCVIRGRA